MAICSFVLFAVIHHMSSSPSPSSKSHPRIANSGSSRGSLNEAAVAAARASQQAAASQRNKAAGQRTLVEQRKVSYGLADLRCQASSPMGFAFIFFIYFIYRLSSSPQFLRSASFSIKCTTSSRCIQPHRTARNKSTTRYLLVMSKDHQ